MKLCADILYWRLKEELTGVLFHGRKNSTLILNRPEFYLDRSQSFEENSVYVCSADHLPQTPELGENVCLVCLGEHWNLNAYYERCSVILIHGSQDIFRIFNLVQEVLDCCLKPFMKVILKALHMVSDRTEAATRHWV